MNGPEPNDYYGRMNPAQTYARAVDALNQGNYPLALQLATAVMNQAPTHGGVHFVAGVAALNLQRIGDALKLLYRATELSPQRPDYTSQFARALAAARLFAESLEAADRAASLGPSDPLTFDTLGVVYTQANEHGKAADMFGRAVQLAPNHATFHFNLATSLTFRGELARAEAAYEACLTHDPRYWKAHLALAQLRRQRPDANHIGRLQRLLGTAAATDNVANMYLHLALAKEFEDLSDYELAFTHLATGKRFGRAGRNYTIDRDRKLFAAIESTFSSAIPGESKGDATEQPIFVFGMPRSGTTLVDRILSSHPNVYSAGELQNFSVALKRLSMSRTPDLLDPETIRMGAAADPAALGKAYVDSTRPGTASAPRFVDKLPHNFLYAGHIARALPNAKLVCLHRNPLDTVLGNFRQLFAQTSPYYDYSFDVVDTAHYYVLFDRLIAHWDRVLPGRIHHVSYETLVADQERVTRDLLAYCALDWAPECLDFHENDAPVATASAVQVREPLNSRSVGRWRRYEAQLEPARQVLVAAGISL